MTEARISIEALRANLDHSAEPCEGECVAQFERRMVLALVEAVEAAHTYLETDAAGDRGALFLALLNAQDRFDFGSDS